jgi:hypothetical protein
MNLTYNIGFLLLEFIICCNFIPIYQVVLLIYPNSVELAEIVNTAI